MTWWAWLVLGAFLFGAELFAIDAQFYLIFLGVSAAIVGLLSSAGVVMPEWVQWSLPQLPSRAPKRTCALLLYVWIAVNNSINRGDCYAVIHEVSKMDNYLDGS